MKNALPVVRSETLHALSLVVMWVSKLNKDHGLKLVMIGRRHQSPLGTRVESLRFTLLIIRDWGST